ncbi:hypothetical protein BJ508DRAFT_410502 [Ascobolus immersus RN42]|uniref:Uncharacterized protein n=1 Tax=Ascobolus immersus RN42 TaxID=1160509 RepID=A0A3N4IPE7_ASCIM|nr:hypothetical protein BJ508DRAFT_410502 [Ascobolus immersus RN42]
MRRFTTNLLTNHRKLPRPPSRCTSLYTAPFALLRTTGQIDNRTSISSPHSRAYSDDHEPFDFTNFDPFALERPKSVKPEDHLTKLLNAAAASSDPKRQTPGHQHPHGKYFPGRELTLSKRERREKEEAYQKRLIRRHTLRRTDDDFLRSYRMDDFEEEDVLDEFQQPIHYEPELVPREEAIAQYKKMMDILEGRRKSEELPEEQLKEVIKPLDEKETTEVKSMGPKIRRPKGPDGAKPASFKIWREFKKMQRTEQGRAETKTAESEAAFVEESDRTVTAVPQKKNKSKNIGAKRVEPEPVRKIHKIRRLQVGVEPTPEPNAIPFDSQIHQSQATEEAQQSQQPEFYEEQGLRIREGAVSTKKGPAKGKSSRPEGKVPKGGKVNSHIVERIYEGAQPGSTPSAKSAVSSHPQTSTIETPTAEPSQLGKSSDPFKKIEPGPLCMALGAHFQTKVGSLTNLSSKIGMPQFEMIENLGVHGETTHLRTLVKAMIEGQDESVWIDDDGILGGQRPRDQGEAVVDPREAARLKRKSAEVMRGVARLIMSDNVLAWEYAKQIMAYLQTMGLLPDSIYDTKKNPRLAAVNNEIFVMLTDAVWSIAEKVQSAGKNGKLNAPVSKDLNFDIQARTIAVELLLAACVEKEEAKTALLLADDLGQGGWKFEEFGHGPAETKIVSQGYMHGPPLLSEMVEIRPRIVPVLYEQAAMKQLEDTGHLQHVSLLSWYLYRKQHRAQASQQPEDSREVRKNLTVWLGRLPSYYRASLQNESLNRLYLGQDTSGPKVRLELKKWMETIQAECDAEAFADLRRSLGSFEKWYRTVFMTAMEKGTALEIDPYFKASILNALCSMGANGRFGDFLFMGKHPIIGFEDLQNDKFFNVFTNSLLRFARFRNRLAYAHDVVQHLLFQLYRSEVEERPCMAIPNAIVDELMNLALHFGMGNLVQDLLLELRLGDVPLRQPENLIGAAYKVSLIQQAERKKAVKAGLDPGPKRQLSWKLPLAQNLGITTLTKSDFWKLTQRDTTIWIKLLDIALEYNDKAMVQHALKKIKLASLTTVPPGSSRDLVEALVLNMIRHDNLEAVNKAVFDLPRCPNLRYDNIDHSEKRPRGYYLVSERLASSVFSYCQELKYRELEYDDRVFRWAREWLFGYYNWNQLDFKRLGRRAFLTVNSEKVNIEETVTDITPDKIERVNTARKSTTRRQPKEDDAEPTYNERELLELQEAGQHGHLNRPITVVATTTTETHTFFGNLFRLHRDPVWWAKALLTPVPPYHKLVDKHLANLASARSHLDHTPPRVVVQEYYAEQAQAAKAKQKEEQRDLKHRIMVTREFTDEEQDEQKGKESMRKRKRRGGKEEKELREREAKEGLLRFLDTVLPM